MRVIKARIPESLEQVQGASLHSKLWPGHTKCEPVSEKLSRRIALRVLELQRNERDKS